MSFVTNDIRKHRIGISKANESHTQLSLQELVCWEVYNKMTGWNGDNEEKLSKIGV